jgi:hypothetical protein
VIPPKLLDAALAPPTGKPKRRYGPVAETHPWKRYGFSKNSLQEMEKRGDICTLRK